MKPNDGARERSMREVGSWDGRAEWARAFRRRQDEATARGQAAWQLARANGSAWPEKLRRLRDHEERSWALQHSVGPVLALPMRQLRDAMLRETVRREWAEREAARKEREAAQREQALQDELDELQLEVWALEEEEERRRRWLARPAPPPEPQPYGVSHAGAEALARDWMRHLGVLDATVTRLVGDGGFDVDSEHFIAQVKNYVGKVSVQECRELFGVSTMENKLPLIFTSGTLTEAALDFTNRAGIAVLQYDAVAGTLTGINHRGLKAVQQSIPEAFAS